MSRLMLLVATVLSAAASSRGVIVFDPAPVSAANCGGEYRGLSPYYQRQLYVLNRPYGGYGYSGGYYGTGSIDITENRCARPTVDMWPCRCGNGEPEELYYRKGDLMPANNGGQYQPMGNSNGVGMGGKGTIFIIPKKLMDRTLKSFQQRTAEVGRKA